MNFRVVNFCVVFIGILMTDKRANHTLARNVACTLTVVQYLCCECFLCIVPSQLAGPGSASGIVCSTSSSSCSARCKCTSTQQGVCLMLCRG